jgi:hypothetical protein
VLPAATSTTARQNAACSRNGVAQWACPLRCGCGTNRSTANAPPGLVRLVGARASGPSTRRHVGHVCPTALPRIRVRAPRALRTCTLAEPGHPRPLRPRVFRFSRTGGAEDGTMTPGVVAEPRGDVGPARSRSRATTGPTPACCCAHPSSAASKATTFSRPAQTRKTLAATQLMECAALFEHRHELRQPARPCLRLLRVVQTVEDRVAIRAAQCGKECGRGRAGI